MSGGEDVYIWRKSKELLERIDWIDHHYAKILTRSFPSVYGMRATIELPSWLHIYTAGCRMPKETTLENGASPADWAFYYHAQLSMNRDRLTNELGRAVVEETQSCDKAKESE